MGYFAKPPIKKLPIAAERHVAAVVAAAGMPASCRIPGFTKMMYAIVMNVVNPARISVRQLAPSDSNSKYRSRRCRTGMGLEGSREGGRHCRGHGYKRVVGAPWCGHLQP